MHFESVTFDLDGTLLDTIADLAEACRLMLAEVGAPPRTPAEVHSFVGKGMAVLVERCLTHDQPPSAERLQEAIESFKHHYSTVNGKYCQIYEGVLEGLAAWKTSGLKMGVVTNKPAMFTEQLLERMGLADYFDVVVSRAAGCLAYAVPYGYNEGKPVDSADCDALVSDLLVAYRQALTFQDLNHK